MRHTTILLRGEKQPQEEAPTQARKDMMDAMVRKANAISTLLTCPGWQEFVQACKDDELAILSAIEKNNDSTGLAKLAGSLLTVKSFQTWPQDILTDLDSAMAELKQE